jgi:hypothetical protein
MTIVLGGKQKPDAWEYFLENGAAGWWHGDDQEFSEEFKSGWFQKIYGGNVVTRIKAILSETFSFRSRRSFEGNTDRREDVFPDANSMLDALARYIATGAIVAREIGAEVRFISPNLITESPQRYKRLYPDALNIDVAERYPPLYRWLRGQLIEIYNKHYPDTKKP